ncbi:cytochrome c biogenesis protein CcsA [Arenicella sp. 4NH20-0111]|uniref:cytochrome C assembly family protein n=1 Tax=Arenicella sp. 4NH20-0111 TaxID=3127648 RepID=UPI00310421C7
MLNTVLPLCAIGLYTVSTGLIAHHISAVSAGNAKSPSISTAFILAWLGTFVHLVFAYTYCFSNGSLNFSLSSMAVLVSGLMSFIFVLGSLGIPIRRLGILVFPLTSASLLFSLFWGKESVSLSGSSSAASVHIVVSILAYCLLAIAAIQALLYVYQERQIKRRATPAMLMALPPLQTMELLLFRLIWTGFALLSLTLLTGAMFSQEIFGKAFEFNHHTILALLGWIVFAILLLKRTIQGLRGSQAVYWTVGGFLLIQLGYFGTKIVSETLSVQ